MNDKDTEPEFNVEEEVKKMGSYMHTYNQEYGEGDYIFDNFYTWYEKLGLKKHIVPTDAESEYLDTITDETEQCKALVHESNHAYNKIEKLRKHVLILFFVSLVFLLFFKCIWILIPSAIIIIYYLYLKRALNHYGTSRGIMLSICYENNKHKQKDHQKIFR